MRLVEETFVAEAHVNRRLAAILCADVAGYARLMGDDEERTLAALKAHRRELIDPLLTQHQGRIVKTTGDGILIEFASVIDENAVASCLNDAPLMLREQRVDELSAMSLATVG